MTKGKATGNDGPKKRGASAAGFHYANLYQCCPRKWYFRYIKGFQNKIVGRPLILGAAFHEGKAMFYQGATSAKAVQAALDIVELSKKEMEIEEYKEVLFRIPIFLRAWIDTFGRNDLKEYKFLAIERQFEVPIEGTPFKMTIRPDAVVQTKVEKTILIMETKTSGFSSRVTEEGVAFGDQATSYLFGVKKMTKWKPMAVLPDIAYWNSKTRNTENIRMIRGDLVFRTDEQIRNFEKSMGQLFQEMSQKAQAYKEGFDPWVLFPRNSYYCVSYSTPCEFAGICRENCELMKKPPVGFKKIGGIKPIGGYVEDQIGIIG
jgi:hypothetical protein